ncbi:hypothetical protein [Sphingobium sp. Z007]|uniref:hypothetical protein n=1 Tax=Sphingobium sp. Z007 TaxID=627495 RepID=UPI000B4A42D0|nr:hypothetical protein [Sphingobium sp. Z007]
MGHSTDVDLLRKRMIAQWTDKSAPLLHDNAKAGTAPPPRFIRFAVRPGTETKANLGNARHRVVREGRVWVHVAIPIGEADANAWALVDKVTTIFANWSTPDGALRGGAITTDVVASATHYMIAVKVFYRSSRIEDA